MNCSLPEVGLDSQCLSYVIDALEGVAEPTDSLAEQRVALVRLYFYTPGTLWTMPTVKREFERISDPVRRAKHQSWTSVLFGPYPLNDSEAVRRRAAELKSLHADEDDRMILAEAEDIGFTTLLSFDKDFVKNLGPHTCLTLTRPASFWESLAIPKGAAPDKVPSPENPSRVRRGGAGDQPSQLRAHRLSPRLEGPLGLTESVVGEARGSSSESAAFVPGCS